MALLQYTDAVSKEVKEGGESETLSKSKNQRLFFLSNKVFKIGLRKSWTLNWLTHNIDNFKCEDTDIVLIGKLKFLHF